MGAVEWKKRELRMEPRIPALKGQAEYWTTRWEVVVRKSGRKIRKDCHKSKGIEFKV